MVQSCGLGSTGINWFKKPKIKCLWLLSWLSVFLNSVRSAIVQEATRAVSSNTKEHSHSAVAVKPSGGNRNRPLFSHLNLTHPTWWSMVWPSETQSSFTLGSAKVTFKQYWIIQRWSQLQSNFYFVGESKPEIPEHFLQSITFHTTS